MASNWIELTADIYFLDPTCTTLKPGSIQTLNLPVKAFCSSPPNQRKSAQSIIEKKALENTLQLNIPTTPCYKSFNELCQRTILLKLPDCWNLLIKPGELLNLNKMLPVYCIPEYEIFIDPSLSFTIRIFAWLLPNNHSLYTVHEKSLNNITVSNLI